jgi:hypothetical protein
MHTVQCRAGNPTPYADETSQQPTRTVTEDNCRQEGDSQQAEHADDEDDSLVSAISAVLGFLVSVLTPQAA